MPKIFREGILFAAPCMLPLHIADQLYKLTYQ